MASSLTYSRSQPPSRVPSVGVTAKAPATQCPPPCPACGGLECLCRPRFFPGQVLTDDDLNRLENYVVAKNRLHNRYFQGPGVVCGLEVVCDLCNTGNVTVNPGYALSPCGDDIIVCNAASVSICDLINQCKPRQDTCDPYSFQQPVDCKQGVQRWVLSICYQETPSRGVQPLMSQPCSCTAKKSCGGNCGCSGGTGGCACGASGGASTSSSATGKTKYNPQCEPTLICEGFSFTATRYVDPKAQSPAGLGRFGAAAVLSSKAAQLGPLVSQLLACYVQAIAIRDAYANQAAAGANDAAMTLAYGEYYAALRDFAAEHASHRCDLARRLACLDTSSVNVGTATVAAPSWASRFGQLNTVWLELFRDCFCSALLPPCPDVSGGNCVPLAVVTINADTCVVSEICNWTAREFALTLPTLAYWTSFVNWGAIQDAIAELCCGTADTRLWDGIMAALGNIVSNNSAAVASPAASDAARAAVSDTSLRDAATRAARTPGATGGTAPAVTDAARPTTAQSAVTATTAALGALLQQATMPDGMARLLRVGGATAAGGTGSGSTAAPSAAAGTPPAGTDVAGLAATVADLKETVARQAKQIAQLMRGK